MRFYFIPNRRFWSLVLLVFVLAFIVAPVAAQGEVPPPEVPPVITVEQAGALLLAAITAIVAGGLGGGPLAAFVVGLLKHIPALNDVSAPTLNLVVGGVLTIIYWLASSLGLQETFSSVTNFVLVAGPALLALLSTMTSASAIHAVGVARRLSVVGYQRTPALKAA